MATTAETNVSNYKVDDATMDQFHNITNFVKSMVVKDSEYYEAAETETSKWFGEKLVKYVEGTLTREEAEDVIKFADAFNKKVDNLAGIGKYSNDFKWIDEKNGKLTNNAIYRLKCWGLYSGYNGDSTVDSEAQTYEDSIMNFIVLYYLTQQPKLENYKNEVTAFLFKKFFTEFFSNDFSLEIDELLKYFNFNDNTKKLLKNNKTDLTNGEFFNYNSNGLCMYINFKDMKNYSYPNGLTEVSNNLLPFLLKKTEESEIKWNFFIDKYFNDKALRFNYLDKKLLINEETFHIFNNGDCFHINNDIIKNAWIIYLGGVFYTNLEFDSNKILGIKDDSDLKIDLDTNIFTKNNKIIDIIIDTENSKYYYENSSDKNAIFNHIDIITDIITEETSIDENFNPDNAEKYYLFGSEDEKEFIFNYSKEEIFYSTNISILNDDNGNTIKVVKHYKCVPCDSYGSMMTNLLTNIKKLTKDSVTGEIEVEFLNNKNEKYIPVPVDGADNAYAYYKTEIIENPINTFIYGKYSYVLDPDEKRFIRTEIYTTDQLKNYTFEIDKTKKLIDSFSKNTSHIENLKSQFINKEKILIEKTEEKDMPEKIIAAEEEKNIISNGELLIFFDFLLSDTRYLILYKELNSAYKSVIFQSLIDITVADENMKNKIFNLKNKNKNISTKITKNMSAIIRPTNTKTSEICIRDFEMETEKFTTQKFKFAYTNPYLARTAWESDIISYYIGDPYTNDGYGRYSYQKEEIYNFLKIYKETRDYFYKVLLNESFIHDEEYKLYEKTFLSIFAIERFISSKIENTKNIDSFDEKDIKNFLVSYGMEDLAEIIDLNDFYNSEELSKNLIKNFVKLVQNKGSRQVIEELQKAFSIDDGELNIYKVLLVKTNSATIGDLSNNVEEYKFFRTEYNTDNIYKEISESKQLASIYHKFINNDKYWSKDDTQPETLNRFNITNETTKYLLSEYKTKIAYNYFVIRVFFAFVEFLVDQINKFTKNVLTTSFNYIYRINIESEFLGTSIDLMSYIEMIREVYEKIIEKSMGSESIAGADDKNNIKNDGKVINSSKVYFKINTDKLKNYYDFFTFDPSSGFSINEEKLIAEFAPLDKNDAQLDLIRTVLDSISPLITLNYNPDIENTNIERVIETYIPKQYDVSISQNIELSNFTILLHKILSFLQIYLDGYNGIALSDITWIDNSAYNFLIKLYEDLFLEIDPNNTSTITDVVFRNYISTLVENDDTDFFTSYSNTYEQEEDLEALSEFVIEGCKELEDVLETTLQLSLSESENNLMKFLKETVEYFISFTTEIKESTYLKEYDTRNETFAVMENLNVMKTTMDLDSFYFDEKLDITLEDK